MCTCKVSHDINRLINQFLPGNWSWLTQVPTYSSYIYLFIFKIQSQQKYYLLSNESTTLIGHLSPLEEVLGGDFENTAKLGEAV